MPQLLLNYLDDAIIAKIVELAKENSLSVEDQAKKLLVDAVGMVGRRRTRLEVADRIAAMTPKGIVQTDSTLLIREDRDR